MLVFLSRNDRVLQLGIERSSIWHSLLAYVMSRLTGQACLVAETIDSKDFLEKSMCRHAI